MEASTPAILIENVVSAACAYGGIRFVVKRDGFVKASMFIITADG
jgi:hypothetical protein